jgi:ABC-2 type transport system ATP-binding protein
VDDDIAIKVDGVYKDFVLPHEKKATLKSAFTNIFHSSRGVEVQHSLHDISLEIKKGEFFGIVGRNGSGKSTLLKILAGIYQPTKGSATTRGKIAPFIELGVGFNPELTGRENVYLNGAMMGFSNKEMDQKYPNIVEFAELERFMDQKLKNYSSGMQVRLAFSVATRAEADILLVDEVLAVGDSDFQTKCFNYFKQLKRDGKTVIFVTHNMDAVR